MTENNENDVIKETEEIDQSNDESSDAPEINEDQIENIEPINDSNLQKKIDEHWDQILKILHHADLRENMVVEIHHTNDLFDPKDS